MSTTLTIVYREPSGHLNCEVVPMDGDSPWGPWTLCYARNLARGRHAKTPVVSAVLAQVGKAVITKTFQPAEWS